MLSDRPAREGDQFILAEFLDNKPVRSFDIVIMSSSADVVRPFKVVYEWTGKGFKTGLSAGKSHVDSVVRDRETNNLDDRFGRTSDALKSVGPVILYTVGGFVVGLAASSRRLFRNRPKDLLQHVRRLLRDRPIGLEIARDPQGENGLQAFRARQICGLPDALMIPTGRAEFIQNYGFYGTGCTV